MIEIPRALIRQFRTVVRQATPSVSFRGVQPPSIVIEAASDGLRLRAHLGDVAVEYHQPGSYSSESLVLPLTALQDFEGRTEEKVVLEATGTDAVQARWHEGVVPRSRDYVAKEAQKPPEFPALPERLVPLPVRFLQALDEARRSAARESVRYALSRILLRGGKGEVVGTDGRQLVIASGFAMPWQDDVLVPAVPVFGHRELAEAESIMVGRTNTHVCVRAGNWTIFLLIDCQGRYPRIEEVIPRNVAGGTTWRLDVEDGVLLRQALPKLPAPEDDDTLPVTIDLNGHAVVRAGAAGQRVTEVVLSRSQVSGPPVRVAADRRYLQRALELGLTEFHVAKPDAPVLAQKDGVRFVWMPLSKTAVLAPSTDAVRVTAPAEPIKRIAAPRQQEVPKVSVQAKAQRRAERPRPSSPKTDRPTTSRSALSVLRSVFAPRGWLWRVAKARR